MPRPYRPSPLRQSTTPLVPLVPQFNRMPPKRRARAPPAPPPSSSSRFPIPSAQPPSSLAKQHRISASTEASIRAAFDSFATKTTTTNSSSSPSTSSASSELTLPTPSLRRALTALSAPARTRADLQDLIAAADPLSTGQISYENFVAVAALQLSLVDPNEDDDNEGDNGDDGVDNDDEEEEEHDNYAMSGRRGGRGDDVRRGKGKGKGRGTSGREIDEAFRLFVGGGGERGDNDRDEVITLGALRRVARELKEDVAEGLLRDMILEANGGAGVGKGVKKIEFEAVMRRAGVFR